LFDVPSVSPHPAIETLRAVDVDRMTPLEALKLVSDLKKLTTLS
jgi:hypothetical protein